MFVIFCLFLQLVFTPVPAKRLQKQFVQKPMSKLHSVSNVGLGDGFQLPPPSLVASENGRVSMLPNGDALDKQIIKIFFPALLSFLITPLTGSVDMFWVCFLQIFTIHVTPTSLYTVGWLHERRSSSWRTRCS